MRSYHHNPLAQKAEKCDPAICLDARIIHGESPEAVMLAFETFKNMLDSIELLGEEDSNHMQNLMKMLAGVNSYIGKERLAAGVHIVEVFKSGDRERGALLRLEYAAREPLALYYRTRTAALSDQMQKFQVRILFN